MKSKSEEQARAYVARILEQHRKHGVEVDIPQKDLTDAVESAKKLNRRVDHQSTLAA